MQGDIKEYIKLVREGKILTNNWVKKAVERFVNLSSRDDIYYDEKAVNQIINFIQNFYLNGVSPKRKFKLEKWQKFILAHIYGLKYKETNRRVTKYIYIEVPRKNGKSELVTAIAMYHFLFDNDALVTISANSREQAKLIDFKKVKQYAHQLDSKEKHLIPYFNQLKMNSMVNEILVTSSDAKRLDGLSVNVGIIDEYHSARDSSVYDVIKSSQGAIDEPLLIVITTAGYDTDSACYQLHTYITNVLDGIIKDDAQFGIIYTLDEGDSIDDETCWGKANPNLGVSLNYEFLRDEVNKAKNSSIEASGVKVKNFNVWLQKNAEKTWLGTEFIDAALTTTINLDDYKNAECYVGVDLGTNTDICCISVCIKGADEYLFKNYYYLPEDSLNTATHKKMYKEWAADGYITLTSGNVTDYDVILKDMVEISKKLRIKQVHYDKYNATQFAIDASKNRIRMVPFSQNAFNYNIPTKGFERLMLQKRVKIDSNPLTKWQLNNVMLKTDLNGNVKPIKRNEENKIDGVVSMIMALAGYVGVRETNVYIV